LYVAKYLSKNPLDRMNTLHIAAAAHQSLNKYPSKATDSGTTQRNAQTVLNRIMNNFMGQGEYSVLFCLLALLDMNSENLSRTTRVYNVTFALEKVNELAGVDSSNSDAPPLTLDTEEGMVHPNITTTVFGTDLTEEQILQEGSIFPSGRGVDGVGILVDLTTAYAYRPVELQALSEKEFRSLYKVVKKTEKEVGKLSSGRAQNKVMPFKVDCRYFSTHLVSSYSKLLLVKTYPPPPKWPATHASGKNAVIVRENFAIYTLQQLCPWHMDCLPKWNYKMFLIFEQICALVMTSVQLADVTAEHVEGENNLALLRYACTSVGPFIKRNRFHQIQNLKRSIESPDNHKKDVMAKISSHAHVWNSTSMMADPEFLFNRIGDMNGSRQRWEDQNRADFNRLSNSDKAAARKLLAMLTVSGDTARAQKNNTLKKKNGIGLAKSLALLFVHDVAGKPYDDQPPSVGGTFQKVEDTFYTKSVESLADDHFKPLQKSSSVPAVIESKIVGTSSSTTFDLYGDGTTGLALLNEYQGPFFDSYVKSKLLAYIQSLLVRVNTGASNSTSSNSTIVNGPKFFVHAGPGAGKSYLIKHIHRFVTDTL
jgi:hypothetical protein